MEADDALVQLAWKHLKELQENACAPPSNAIVTFPSAAACVGGFTQCPRVVGTHVCGSSCQHLVLDETGFWTCSLSGMVVSQQLSNGSYDQNRFMDDVVIPTPRPRSKRTWNAEDFYPNMIAACSQALNQLLNADKRELVDKNKLEKARKAAFRLAATQFEHMLAHTVAVGTAAGGDTPTLMRLLNSTYAEFEKLGGCPSSHVVTQTKIHSIASIAAQIYGTVIVPYVAVNTKKPVNSYYAVAVLYMLSTGTFGKALHIPLLTATLPDEKSLKNLGFIVSRMTSAKRYILDALNHYLQRNKRHNAARAPPSVAQRAAPDAAAALKGDVVLER